MKTNPIILAGIIFGVLTGSAMAAEPSRGKAVYESSCIACHGTGVAGAPKVGDSGRWSVRIKSGMAALYASAIKGKSAMPPKGGNPALSDEDIRATVDYMVAQSGAGKPSPAASAAKLAAAKEAAPVEKAEISRPDPVGAAVTTAAPLVPPAMAASEVNRFNRLLMPVGRRHPPPAEDGIHDPSNDATHVLQPPLDAYTGFPPGPAGNGVDWVKTLEQGKIKPRYDRKDPNAAPVVMDLNIVREVKGSMPDVVYPHKQHTEWLDCSNCHPAIFIPQKGANQISMAQILLGQKCGVCHGKVAFPVSECRLCHSKKKPMGVAQTGKN